MGKVLSDDKRNPHRFDPSPRNKRGWEDRGWRIRSDLVYPNETLCKAGTRIEELETRVAELEKTCATEYLRGVRDGSGR